MGARKRSVFRNQSAAPQLDLSPHQVEVVLLGPNGGHRITDESNIASISCCKGCAYDDGIDMDTVEDDSWCQALVRKGNANNSRFAGAHGRHCIEEMCHSAKPLFDRHHQSVGAGFAVSN